MKIYHPEDDPEGFQKLREAYDSALKEAKYIKEVKSANSEIEDNNEINTLIYENKKINTKVSRSSFEEYGLADIAGRQFWLYQLPKESADNQLELVSRLILDAESPWCKIDWNTDIKSK